MSATKEKWQRLPVTQGEHSVTQSLPWFSCGTEETSGLPPPYEGFEKKMMMPLAMMPQSNDEVTLKCCKLGVTGALRP